MGAKIITEKDFWMCSSGAMPAQLQGTRTSNKKRSGEAYITVADTATSSWIDFGCTKNMLFAALIAAVVVVVVVALVVGTGGIAAIGLLGMMAIGAGAGIAGGIVAAVHGALKCGQKNAPQRSWSSSKQNMILTGAPAITGAHTMTCKVGGTVTFAPEVKSWTHAIALGGLNYLTKFAECGLAGAAVGGGGYLFAGLASGSLALAWPSVPSVLGNVTGSFTGVWGASRALFGLDSLANEQAYGRVQDGGDALSAFGGGAVPEVGMAQRIFTGQAQPADYLIFLYLLNVKAGRNAPPVEERPANSGKEEGNPTDKDGNNTPEEEGSPTAATEAGEVQNNRASGKNGEAFEDPAPPPPRMNQITGDPPFRRNPAHDAPEFQRQIEGQQNGMNQLTVEEFLANRNRYLREGRASEGGQAQQRFREQAYADRVRENRRQGMTREQAETEAQNWMDTQAALHDPDQIAGGNPQNVTGMGDRNVNSSLGSQWKTRIDAIDQQVRQQAANMTPEEQANTLLNIHLPWR